VIPPGDRLDGYSRRQLATMFDDEQLVLFYRHYVPIHLGGAIYHPADVAEFYDQIPVMR
jgi:hypothetical protein